MNQRSLIPRDQGLNANEAARQAVLMYSRVVAIVGRSNDHYYTSYDVGAYLQQHGYIVYSVNPNIEEVDGEHVYASLSEIPAQVDVVNVFRKSQFLPQIVDQAIAIGAPTVWAQLSVISDEARDKARRAGLNYAENLCMRTEHERLFSQSSSYQHPINE
ncbi:MAG: CoA-binding protein [Anaerolineae bacterium]|nr:CoA-binding protein [Anaerolineae bacterium]